MRDIACAGYVAGCNTQFFTNEAGTHTLGTGQNNIMRRLSFADDVGGSYQSMLAFPCHAGQFVSGHLDTVCSVTTRLLPWEVTSAGGGTHNSFPGGDAMFREYNNKLGLSSIHFGEDMKARSLPRLVPGAPFAHLAAPFGRPPRTWSSSRRARPTTRRASSARTAATTRSPRPSTRSSRGRATCAAAAAAAHPPSPPLAAHRRCARSAVWPRRDSGRRALEARGEHFPQGGAGFDGRPRAGQPGADGLPEARVSARRFGSGAAQAQAQGARRRADRTRVGVCVRARRCLRSVSRKKKTRLPTQSPLRAPAARAQAFRSPGTSAGSR